MQRDDLRPDNYRAVKLPIDQHGADAALRAAERADQLVDAGDMIGAADTKGHRGAEGEWREGESVN